MDVTARIASDKLEVYFDAFSKRFLRNDSTGVADVEVVSIELGDQILTEGAHICGITYDRGTNVLDIALEGRDHRVYHPKEIWTIETSDGFINAIEIVRDDDAREIVKLARHALRAD